jgi:CDP-glucose 4,6-dehydratase
VTSPSAAPPSWATRVCATSSPADGDGRERYPEVRRPDLVRHWARRSVLVTGHSGFIGSWLSTALVQLGADVTGFADDADETAASRSCWLQELGVRSVRGDIRDIATVTDVMSARPFDAVFHLAARPLVRDGYCQPYATISTNVTGTLNILETARITGPPALVHVSSDKCYRPALDGHRPHREGDPLGGNGPYALSKASAEMVFAAYAADYATSDRSTRALAVRLGNVVGGGDHADRLVPNCLRALAGARTFVPRDSSSIRPWQHVLDVVHGLLLAGAKLLVESAAAQRRRPDQPADELIAGRSLNFAPPHSTVTSGMLVQALVEAWRDAGDVVADHHDDDDDSRGFAFPEEHVLRLDGSTAARILDWHHRFGHLEMATDAVAWHRAVAAGAAPRAATLEHTAAFLSSVLTGSTPSLPVK